MITEITALNAPMAFSEALWKIIICGVDRDSRNGKVKYIPDPVYLTIQNPIQRIVSHPIRNANPFFHVAEFVWMMAGSEDASWIGFYNSRMTQYADGAKYLGAYGHRWRKHFLVDQIIEAAKMLKRDKNTRRVVLGIWDPSSDFWPESSDVPCNTHIYLSVSIHNKLDMTVCNRSNDLIWGMLGANVVHMTLLQELLANATGYKVGQYRVFTNNLHIYHDVPNYEKYMTQDMMHSIYDGDVCGIPILQPKERIRDFLWDCERLVEDVNAECKTLWCRHVAQPMLRAYHERKEGRGNGLGFVHQIMASDWRTACQQWVERRELVSAPTDL